MAISRFYSRQGLWSLFLMCALPLHIWTFFLAFRDFDWITARTNSWDAVGVIAYGLLFALIESAVIFLAAALLGLLVSAKWEEKRRIALMSALVVILSLWSIFNQSYFLRDMPPPAWLGEFAYETGRPVLTLYVLALILTSLSFLIPTYFILRSDKTLRVVQGGMERLSLLMTLYLVFDAVSLVIILIRNL